MLNKCDLSSQNNETISYMSKLNKNVIKASMKTKEGIEELYNLISDMFKNNEIDYNDEIIVTNIRHKNIIHRAIENITGTTNRIEQNIPIDVISVYIKEVLENLAEITGDNVSEDIINNIFAKFCLGK